MKVKGLIHCHSNYSYDGKESLTSLKAFLKANGINFCCLTEHTDFFVANDVEKFVAECKSLSDSEFVFIPGFEVPYKDTHILLIGTEVFLAQTANSEILKNWKQSSALTILAHPVRNSFIVDETIRETIDGVEIWNQQYEGKHVPRSRSVRLFEQLKQSKPALLATGGTDFHRQEHFGAPIFELEVANLSTMEILTKLKTGNYTFGSEKITVQSDGSWHKNEWRDWIFSMSSILVINTGKKVNAILASLGLRLPKKLKQVIRSQV